MLELQTTGSNQTPAPRTVQPLDSDEVREAAAALNRAVLGKQRFLDELVQSEGLEQFEKKYSEELANEYRTLDRQHHAATANLLSALHP